MKTNETLSEVSNRVLNRAHSNNTYAHDVDGTDPEEIAQFIMEGVLDNDHVNNNDIPTIWDDAHDAVSVYTDNGADIQWDDEAIDAATPIVEAMMKSTGNLEA